MAIGELHAFEAFKWLTSGAIILTKGIRVAMRCRATILHGLLHGSRVKKVCGAVAARAAVERHVVSVVYNSRQ